MFLCVCVLCAPGSKPAGCRRMPDARGKGGMKGGMKAKESGTTREQRAAKCPRCFVHICIPYSTCAWRRVKYKLPFPFFLSLYLRSRIPSACAYHVPRTAYATCRISSAFRSSSRKLPVLEKYASLIIRVAWVTNRRNCATYKILHFDLYRHVSFISLRQKKIFC